jgi:glycosyltransferase involved in cell wall biosynthesis
MLDKLPLAVIVLTHNEAANIQVCLDSIAGWTQEIFVVDSGSTDRTLEIAGQYTDNIIYHPFENYAQQRNWAQDNLALNCSWILHVDADERVTPELRKAIYHFFETQQDQRFNGAFFSRRAIFMGRWIRHGGHYPVYHTRLFRRDRGRCEERLYDQHFLVEPPVKQLEGDLIDVLTCDLDTWSLRHIRWAGKEAEEITGTIVLSKQVASKLFGTPIERRRWLRNNLFGTIPPFIRAFGYFLYRYFFRLGFLDGTEGLIFHFLQACWFRFYIDAKLWEMRQHHLR